MVELLCYDNTVRVNMWECANLTALALALARFALFHGRRKHFLAAISARRLTVEHPDTIDRPKASTIKMSQAAVSLVVDFHFFLANKTTARSTDGAQGIGRQAFKVNGIGGATIILKGRATTKVQGHGRVTFIVTNRHGFIGVACSALDERQQITVPVSRRGALAVAVALAQFAAGFRRRNEKRRKDNELGSKCHG